MCLTSLGGMSVKVDVDEDPRLLGDPEIAGPVPVGPPLLVGPALEEVGEAAGLLLFQLLLSGG